VIERNAYRDFLKVAQDAHTGWRDLCTHFKAKIDANDGETKAQLDDEWNKKEVDVKLLPASLLSKIKNFTINEHLAVEAWSAKDDAEAEGAA
jgi:hypothetical protein